MKLDANILLAVTTVIALTLIVTVAVSVGPDGVALKYIGAAVMSVCGFLVLNRLWMINRKRKPKPMIQPGQPGVLLVALTFPLAMVLSAGLPLLAPHGEYGIMIIMAGVFTGLTIQSAAAARMAQRQD